MTELELTKFSNPVCSRAYTNCLYLNKKNKSLGKHVELCGFVFNCKYKSFVPVNTVVTNNCNRIQVGSNFGQKVNLVSYIPEKLETILKLEVLITPFESINQGVKYSPIDFQTMFSSLNLEYITKTQDFIGKIDITPFKIHVQRIFGISELKRGKYSKITELVISVEKISLSGSVDKKKEAIAELVNFPNLNLFNYGIGGMDSEFRDMIREVFLSRTIDPDEFAKLGIKHQKGMIIHGPSGVGKTSLARALSKMITEVKPIIINGPEILNKFVGQSEENIRNLFKAAESDFKLKGIYSDLHVIIFDEFDAIAKKRTRVPNSSSNVCSNVVNQLLTKIDGIETLDNILVIGITNRFELLDEAILRRFGYHLEIKLPDNIGRNQIFSIHTQGLEKAGILDPDVNINTLVERTKNFTGAEIEKLIQKATSYAIERDTHLNQSDFLKALTEIIPRYGNTPIKIPKLFMYNRNYITLIKELGEYISNFSKNRYLNYSTLLIEGPIGSGKTTLVSKLISESNFSYSRIITSEDLLVLSHDHAKTMFISSVFSDSEKSDKSVIFLDNLEQIMEKTIQGVSKDLLHTLQTLINRKPRNTKLLIIATSSSKELVKSLGLLELFDMLFTIPLIQNSDVTNIITSISSEAAKSMFPEKFTIKDLLTILGNTEQYKVDQACRKYFYRYKTQLE